MMSNVHALTFLYCAVPVFVNRVHREENNNNNKKHNNNNRVFHQKVKSPNKLRKIIDFASQTILELLTQPFTSTSTHSHGF